MKRKRILAFSLVLVLLFTRAGGFNPPVSVYGAGFGTTVAEYIVTLLASVNMAITEPVTLNNINASFGNLALNTVTQAELQTAVNSFNTAMGSSKLIDSFSTTALEAQQYINVTGTEFLNGYQIAATSGADNLFASISNYNSTGVMAPVAGAASYVKAAGPIIGAVAAGVGLGFLIDHLRSAYQNNIGKGLYSNQVALINKPAVYFWSYDNPSTSPYYYTVQGNDANNIIMAYHIRENTPNVADIYFINNSNSIKYFAQYEKSGRQTSTSWSVSAKSVSSTNQKSGNTTGTQQPRFWGGVQVSGLEGAKRYINISGNPYYSPIKSGE